MTQITRWSYTVQTRIYTILLLYIGNGKASEKCVITYLVDRSIILVYASIVNVSCLVILNMVDYTGKHVNPIRVNRYATR